MRCTLLSRLLLPLVATGLLFAGVARAQVMTVEPVVNVVPSIIPVPADGIAATPVTAPPSLYGIAGGGSVEQGQDVLLTVQFYGTGEGQAYQWKKNGTVIPGATAATYAMTAVTDAAAGTYTVTVSNSAGSSVATTDVTVKPFAAPVITSQPRAQVVYVNQPVTFTVYATGSYPRTYQWRRDGVAIPGASQALYTLPAVTTADAAGYSVLISNAQGTATSTSASLTVNAAVAPVIYNSSPYDTTIVAGQSLSLGVSLSNGSTPFTYEWYKNGAVVAGQTTNQLTILAATLADAGKYSVKVTNIAGTATSREATVIVNPPTPVSFSTQPQSQTLAEGQNLNLYAYVNGSSPITFQWQKNGAAIPGATYSNYGINEVALTDAGTYTLVATNAAGSVTSNAATVVVNAAVPPTITTAPQGQSVAYGGSINLSVRSGGTTPLQYQWKKDGVALPGATYDSYSVYNATPANSGQYTVTVTNRAGTVTSSPVAVTVSAAVPPVITTQPVSVQVAFGLSASFSVNYSTSGTGPVTVQWNRNGVAIPGASYSNYSINSVKDADAGDYTVVITGIAGSATSSKARLTVLPPAAPKVNYWPTSTTTQIGGSLYLSVYTVEGSPPITYQWYRDGTAIAGATNSSYNLYNTTAADFGSYQVVVRNDGGVAASPLFRVQPSPSATAPWVAAAAYGDIVYFLATQPSRIERYDLAAEKWLPSVNLSDTLVPTAFVPAAEGMYIAYGRTLVRRTLELTAETTLLNAPNPINQLQLSKDYVYYRTSASTSSYDSSAVTYALNRATQAATGASVTAYLNMTFATRSNRGYGSNVAGGYTNEPPLVFTANPDGSLTTVPMSYRYNYYQLPNGPRVFLLDNEDYVTTTGGTVYRATDMTFVAALGEPFTDLATRADGSLVLLRTNELAAVRPSDFSETGRAKLSFTGARLFAHGSDVFSFCAGGSGGAPFAVAKVAASGIVPPSAPSVSNGAGEQFSIDGVFFGNGVVDVVSRSKRAVVRWSTDTKGYLSAVPLRSAPRVAAQKPGSTRGLLVYDDGLVTAVPLGTATPAETQIGSVGNRAWGITDLGGDYAMLNVSDYGDSGDFRLVIGPGGRVSSASSWSYWGEGQAWNAALRRLYSGARFTSNGGVQYETVAADGTLAGTPVGGSATGLQLPVRMKDDGSLLLSADGQVVNADLAGVGALANAITDAAWLSRGLFTLHANSSGIAEVQRWANTTYFLDGAVTLTGTPLRMFPVSASQLVVVTTVRGYLAFTLVNADLSVVTPPTPASYAGTYIGQLGTGGASGNLALLVRSDGTGVLLANATTTHAGLLADTVTLNSDGTFLASARDLASGVVRTVAGSIASDGTFSGSIASLSLAFSGARVTGTAAVGGYYSVDAVNGANGHGYAIAAPDGRMVVVVQSATAIDGGEVAMDSTGAGTLNTTAGNQLTFAVTSGGGLTITSGKGAFLNLTFGGLRDGVAHTDRLANISTRGQTGSGEQAMIAGFVVTGSAPRSVLIRALGPKLADFGVGGAVADPKVTLYRGTTVVAMGDNWSSDNLALGANETATRVGTFTLPVGSKDAALSMTLDPGNYTAQVTAATGADGVALVEVYDAGTSIALGAPRIINISTRGRVGTGENALIAGIVITGNAPKRVLVRAVGPTLGDFGVGGTLADPTISILSGTTTLLSNDDWGLQTNGVTTADIIAATNSVGGFGLTAGSKDSAVILTLPPGSYTAMVSAKGTQTGIALVEVYELSGN